MSFLSFISNKKIWVLISLFIKFYLIFFYRIKIDRNFYCEGFPNIKIRGKSHNIVIGKNVNFMGSVDLRNRENGKIIIGDNVVIEEYSRFVAAKDSIIKIGDYTKIGAYAIWNAGGNIFIGEKCIFAMRSSLNSNEHLTKKNQFIQDQGFFYKDIIIKEDCLFGVNVSVNKGVNIAKGSVFGSNSVIVDDSIENSINVGLPAKHIKFRE